MYRIKYVEPGEQGHSGTLANLPECHVYYNNEMNKIITGPTAKIKARKYVEQHAFYVKKNDHGLHPIEELVA